MQCRYYGGAAEDIFMAADDYFFSKDETLKTLKSTKYSQQF